MTAHKFPNLKTQESEQEVVVGEHLAEVYSLQGIEITLRNGSVVSLVDVMTVMEIYEDIFNPTISGFIEIRDYVGGLEKFQLTGGELLSIRVLKPNSSSINISRNDLVIHTIAKGRYDNNNAIVYKLEFTTLSAIESQKNRVYKSYKGQRNIAPIIEDLVSQIGSTVNIESEIDSTLSKDFVSPGYTPIQAINFLAKRACASGDYYLFFERLTTGRTFAGVNNLRDLAPKLSGGDFSNIYNVTFSPSIGYTEAAGAESAMTTDVFETQNNFNHIINMNKGLYKSKVTTLNLANRSYGVSGFDYRTGANDFYVNDLLNDASTFGSFRSEAAPGERVITQSMNDPMSDKASWIKSDLHGALLMSGIRVNIEISGPANMIGAGDIINLKVPSDVAKAANLESYDIIENNMYSGKYFVTACKHTITPKSYTKKLELARGSVRQSLVGNSVDIKPFANEFISTSTTDQITESNISAQIIAAGTSEAITTSSVGQPVVEKIAPTGESRRYIVPDRVPRRIERRMRGRHGWSQLP
jgi:hypothetical protein